jgi:hypothetical protein
MRSSAFFVQLVIGGDDEEADLFHGCLWATLGAGWLPELK